MQAIEASVRSVPPPVSVLVRNIQEPEDLPCCTGGNLQPIIYPEIALFRADVPRRVDVRPDRLVSQVVVPEHPCADHDRFDIDDPARGRLNLARLFAGNRIDLASNFPLLERLPLQGHDS